MLFQKANAADHKRKRSDEITQKYINTELVLKSQKPGMRHLRVNTPTDNGNQRQLHDHPKFITPKFTIKRFDLLNTAIAMPRKSFTFSVSLLSK